MIQPTLEAFRELARPGALVPVYREIMADLETPVSAYMKIARGQQYAFLLESVDQANTIGVVSFTGAIIKQNKGIDGTCSLRTRCTSVGQYPCLAFQGYCNIQSLALVLSETVYCLCELAGFDQNGRIFQILPRLFREDAMDIR